jgi:hypothetical protein
LAAVASAAILAAGVGSGVAAATHPKIEASIFSYDGSDFVRTQTTLVTEKGQSAANTKLDHPSPAYKALAAKHSYVGEVTLYGKKYDANYAPLTGDDGKVTGALFVGIAK